MVRDFERHYAAYLAKERARKVRADWDRQHPGPWTPAQLLNKEGRVFSSDNRRAITGALDEIAKAINAMHPHMTALNDLMAATDPHAADGGDEDDEDEGSED